MVCSSTKGRCGQRADSIERSCVCYAPEAVDFWDLVPPGNPVLNVSHPQQDKKPAIRGLFTFYRDLF